MNLLFIHISDCIVDLMMCMWYHKFNFVEFQGLVIDAKGDAMCPVYTEYKKQFIAEQFNSEDIVLLRNCKMLVHDNYRFIFASVAKGICLWVVFFHHYRWFVDLELVKKFRSNDVIMMEVITCPVKCGMKLFIPSQTRSIISSDTQLGM